MRGGGGGGREGVRGRERGCEGERVRVKDGKRRRYVC